MQISSGIIKMSLMGKLETMLYVSSFSSNFRLEFTDKTFLFYNIQTNRTLLMFQSIAFWFVFFFLKKKTSLQMQFCPFFSLTFLKEQSWKIANKWLSWLKRQFAFLDKTLATICQMCVWAAWSHYFCYCFTEYGQVSSANAVSWMWYLRGGFCKTIIHHFMMELA